MPILRIAVNALPAGPIIRVNPNADGTFEFTSVQPDNYLLMLARTCTGCDSANINIANSVPFTVTDKDITGLSITAGGGR